MSNSSSSLALAAQEVPAGLAPDQQGRGARPQSHQDLEQHPHWAVLSRLPMRVTVGVPLPRFRVRDLLALAAGQLILSAWPSTTDVPVEAGSAQLSWAEFEVVEQRMAVRLTRLA